MIRNRQLIILGIAAVILSVLTVFLATTDRWKGTDSPAAGKYILQGFNPEKVYGIQVVSSQYAIQFKRFGDSFVITTRYGYPASNEKMNELLGLLTDIQSVEKVTARKQNHGSLGVTVDQGATVIRLFDEVDRKMAGVVIGKRSEGAPGNYVRLEDDDTVYISSTVIPPISFAYTDYVQKHLFSANPGEYSKLSVSTNPDSYAIDIRDGGGFLNGLPRGVRQDDQRIDEILTTSLDLKIKNVFKKGDLKDLRFDTKLQLTKRDRTSYRVDFAEGGDRCYVRAAAEYSKPAGEIIIYKNESQHSLKIKESLLLARDRVVAFNKTHEKWVYEVDPRYRKILLASPSRLVRK
jgi:hypothetical protein